MFPHCCASIFPKIHMITQWTHSRIRFLPFSGPKYCIKNPDHGKNKLKMFQNSKRTFLFPSTPRFPQIPSLSPQFVFRQAVAEAAHQLFQAFGRSQEAKIEFNVFQTLVRSEEAEKKYKHQFFSFSSAFTSFSKLSGGRRRQNKC